MNPQQVRDVAQRYRNLLETLSTKAERAAPTLLAPVREQALSHALWMCREIPSLVNEKRTEKAMRWLGFVQGTLWCFGITSVQELKDDNRSGDLEHRIFETVWRRRVVRGSEISQDLKVSPEEAKTALLSLQLRGLVNVRGEVLSVYYVTARGLAEGRKLWTP